MELPSRASETLRLIDLKHPGECFLASLPNWRSYFGKRQRFSWRAVAWRAELSCWQMSSTIGYGYFAILPTPWLGHRLSLLPLPHVYIASFFIDQSSHEFHSSTVDCCWTTQICWPNEASSECVAEDTAPELSSDTVDRDGYCQTSASDLSRPGFDLVSPFPRDPYEIGRASCRKRV